MSDQFTTQLSETVLFGLQLFVELAFLFVLISFLVGVLNEWLPAEKVKKYLSARKGRGYLVGALLGSITPFCSCSTVPLTVGLLRSGAGFGPTMALLFTSPLVNPIIVTLFVTAFGYELTLLYSGMAIGLAISISWFLERFGFERYIRRDALGESVPIAMDLTSSVKSSSEGCCSGNVPQPMAVAVACDCESGVGKQVEIPITVGPAVAPVKERHFHRIMLEAIKQFRTFLPHIMFGVGIGAVAHGFVPEALIAEYAGQDNLLAVPVAAFVGVPLYVRASTMIPIALSLTAKGMSVGAVVALVIGGAGASIPEVAMLKRLFRWPILVAFLLSVFGIAIVTGFLANLIA